ncbi:MAG: carbohydrate ABC transporter permease [Lachnospiraceae bacterium]|nr:carbohydrate ABC transporter permease [Lachnospiraceae bacterium]
MVEKKRKKYTAVDWYITILVALIGLIIAYPLFFVVIASISDPNLVNSGQVWLFPKGIHFDGYKMVLMDKDVMLGYRNSIIYTVVGTFCNVFCTVMAGYALSRKDLFGRKFFNWFIAIPMWFSGGLIPTYLTVDSLGLVNKPVVLILLTLVSSYNIIICRSFMSSLPYELQESAKIDGASDFQILRQIILPLSGGTIAVLCLYYGVAHWNSYFNPMIYLNNRDFLPLQVFLREYLLLDQRLDVMETTDAEAIMALQQMAQVMKYSLIVVASVPFLVLYPMLQKYFAKGIMIGAVKG